MACGKSCSHAKPRHSDISPKHSNSQMRLLLRTASAARIAGWLLVPYLGWVSLAAVLNFTIRRLNVA